MERLICTQKVSELIQKCRRGRKTQLGDPSVLGKLCTKPGGKRHHRNSREALGRWGPHVCRGESLESVQRRGSFEGEGCRNEGQAPDLGSPVASWGLRRALEPLPVVGSWLPRPEHKAGPSHLTELLQSATGRGAWRHGSSSGAGYRGGSRLYVHPHGRNTRSGDPESSLII